MPHTQHPLSPEQLAANRANAAKSTGPRTPQGKARSTQNARKHDKPGPRRWRYRNHARPEPQLPAGRRFPPLRQQVQQLVPAPALSGPGGTPRGALWATRGRGVRKAQSPEGRITKRSHFRGPTRTKYNHLCPFGNEPSSSRRPLRPTTGPPALVSELTLDPGGAAAVPEDREVEPRPPASAPVPWLANPVIEGEAFSLPEHQGGALS